MSNEHVIGQLNVIKLFVLYKYGSNNVDIDFLKIDMTEINNFKTLIKSFHNIHSYELLERYIMLELYFKSNYNQTVNMNDAYTALISNNKEHFRYLCFRNINYIKNVKIDINTYYQSTKHNETVFIEFRNFHHIEFNIRNMCIRLPKWKHTIICGPENYSMVKSICDKISVHINIINLNITLTSIDEYSLMLGSAEFWKLLTGERILIHQDDSLILDATHIDEFLEYDYVGAVWPSIYPTEYLVGNGGFSLRNRQLMIKICDNYNIRTYEGFEFTKSYMIENKLKIIPEYCFFVKCIVDNKLGIIAPYDKAQYFSYESVYVPDTIGCHKPWLSNENWINDFTKINNKLQEQEQNTPNVFKNIKTVITYTDNTKSFNESSILKTKIYKSRYIPKLINTDLIDTINNFILIVDFENVGGGTTFFINTIVSYYKSYKTFIIIRNYNHRIHININEEYEFNTIFDDNTINDFLIKNKNKIEKIFINHTLGHSIHFLNALSTLNKEIVTITHDMYFINDCAQPMINQLQNIYNNQNKMSINKCNKIITQNTSNLHIFREHIDKSKEIIVTNLPDYRDVDQCIHTNNSNIVIGIIGVISDIKGARVLSNIIEHYKNNSNVEIIVFGWYAREDFKNKYIYDSVSELNQLLIQFKPNIMIELSLWPETYSYTLSLNMITQLPIMYLKKPAHFTVEERLSHYNKAFSFEDLNQFDKLIHKHKQNYFYTIKPTIYFNSFWDEYFGKVYTPNIDNKNIVLITSKMVVSSKPFSYVKTRSIFTKEERFIQTLHTIRSIREKIPDAFIVLVDNSKLTTIEIDSLRDKTDYFINIIDDNELNYYTDEHELKLFSELSQQLMFYKHFIKKIDVSKIKHFFKMSGRYYINDTFDYNIFNNDSNIFKKNDTVTDRDYYYTSFYKLNKNEVLHYFESLNNIMKEKDEYTKDIVNDFEVIIPRQITNKIIVDHLGITQIFSCFNVIDNI